MKNTSPAQRARQRIRSRARDRLVRENKPRYLELLAEEQAKAAAVKSVL